MSRDVSGSCDGAPGQTACETGGSWRGVVGDAWSSTFMSSFRPCSWRTRLGCLEAAHGAPGVALEIGWLGVVGAGLEIDWLGVVGAGEAMVTE